jgi:hypothetical protein
MNAVYSVVFIVPESGSRKIGLIKPVAPVTSEEAQLPVPLKSKAALLLAATLFVVMLVALATVLPVEVFAMKTIGAAPIGMVTKAGGVLLVLNGSAPEMEKETGWATAVVGLKWLSMP